MSDSDITNQPTPNSGKGGIVSGLLSWFKQKGRPSPFSTSDMNDVVAAIRALQNITAVVIPADPDSDGTYQQTAEFKRSGTNIILTLKLAPNNSGSGGSGGGSSSSGYRGIYDSTLFYAKGDIVRVQSGASQGVWICVITGPTSSNPPTFPEPITVGGTNYWDMWAFGVYENTVCSSGSKKQYFNANIPA